ncbi:hypothetical protein ACWGGS_19315 [Streptomyces decoyicus]
MPLLIVVSAADPTHGRGFAQWLGDGIGVSTTSREHIGLSGSPGPGQAARTTTSFGLAALAVFGLSLGAVVQTGYERVWELSPARWYARWRHVLWLVVLVGYLFMSATTTLWRQSSALTSAALLCAVLFF